MNVFFSYPRSKDNTSSICDDIFNIIASHGHKVWRDKDNLFTDYGVDWRKKITEAIRDSQVVVSCLNKHAVRDDSGCLEELKIAVSLKGGNIKGILLDSIESVKPRAILGHRQWLDLSDWAKEANDGNYNSWLKKKAGDILKMIENDDTFDAEISQIKKYMPRFEYNIQRLEILKRPYISRKWLEETIENWKNDTEGGNLCAIYGDKGIGKSTFAVNYAFLNPCVAAVLCFEYDKTTYNNFSSITQSIAYQLAIRLPDYRYTLLKTLKEHPISEMNESVVFDQLIIKPLNNKHFDGGHETLLIILDGLDECSQEEMNIVASILRDAVDRLPRWLRIIITSRKYSSVQMRISPSKEIDINGSNYHNREDIRKYIYQELEFMHYEEDQLSKLTNTLLERSEGCFYYVYLAIDAIKNSKMDPFEVDEYPKGLENIIYKWLEREFPDDIEYKKEFRMPIGMILASPDDFPVLEFERLLDMSSNGVNDLLLRLQIFLRHGENYFGEATIAFENQFVYDFLKNHKGYNRFYASTDDALKIMTEHIWEYVNFGADELTTYETLYCLSLLQETKMKNEYNSIIHDRKLGRKLASRLNDLYEDDKYDKSIENHILHDLVTIYGAFIEENAQKEDVLRYFDFSLKLINPTSTLNYYDCKKVEEDNQQLDELLKEIETYQYVLGEKEYYLMKRKIQETLDRNLIQCGETVKTILEKYLIILPCDKKRAEEETNELWNIVSLDYEMILLAYKKLNDYEKAIDICKMALSYFEINKIPNYIYEWKLKTAICHQELGCMFAGRIMVDWVKENGNLEAVKGSDPMGIYEMSKGLSYEDLGDLYPHYLWEKPSYIDWIPVSAFDLSEYARIITKIWHRRNRNEGPIINDPIHRFSVDSKICKCLLLQKRYLLGMGKKGDLSLLAELCSRIANNLEDEGIEDIALQMFYGAIIIFLQTDGNMTEEDMNIYLICCEHSADILEASNEYDNALLLYQHVMEFRKKRSDFTNHPVDCCELARSIYFYAGCLEQLKQYVQAAKQYKKAFDIVSLFTGEVEKAIQDKRAYEKAYTRCSAKAALE